MANSAGPAIFAVALAALVAAFSWPGVGNAWLAGATFLWAAFVGMAGFFILRSGKIARWRAIVFIAMAFGFLVYFKSASLGLTGRLWTTEKPQEVPYCHIAIASGILNYFYQQYLALKSGAWSRWGPLTLGFLWLALTLIIGRAWCSWVCFYGGLDESFSRIAKRPRWLYLGVPEKWRDLPAGILIFMILVSFSSLLPIFCLWVCPLKITTAFLDPNDAARKIQLAIFAVLGVATIVIIPILSKRRAFCGLICPFGAWQSFFGGLNPFRATIKKEDCTQCRLCLIVCPTFAISQEGLKKHEISPYCNLCGLCMDRCPRDCIDYTVFGRSLPGALSARTLFLFFALLAGGSVGALFMPQALSMAARSLARLFLS
ncbi:MAG: 4Fe-4S binding protein [Elusimicrobiota bacterium]